ncbi:GNAT family N-acetyltransferase [soil metagenome]
MTDDGLEIVNNETERQWEARLDGEVVGYAEYRLMQGRVVFTHTVVEPAQEGKGIGSRLVATALDDALARNLRISPRCPFIRAYIEDHPEYAAATLWPEPDRWAEQA